ncbi:MAG: glycosyltransferase family 4 protein [Prevotellaceae bacterium]|jgi:glycosyltransferase involved in cell wall biosynthesis|nr:glycosyltransferase family 4 protein [Prevotellaceae bacterium]
MKVVLLSTSERTGGAAIAANRLMRALGKAGHEVHMLVRDRQTSDENVISVNTSWLKAKINFLRFAWERFVIFAHNRFSRKNLFSISIANTGTNISRHPLVKSADIIHLHWINQGFLSLKNIRQLTMLGKPIVWTMHDMWAATGICHYTASCEKYRLACRHCPMLTGGKSKDLSQKTLRKKEKSGFAQIHYVGCSRWIAEQAKSSKLLSSAAFGSIPNAIDTEVFYPSAKSAARKKLQLPADKRLLLFSAAKISDTRKGGAYFVEACNMIYQKYPEAAQDIEIVLMGKGDEAFFSTIKMAAHTLRYIASEAELAEGYAAVDAFVIPSLEDNLPNTIMESLACGTPCVGFNVGGIPEMIDHKKNGYVAEYKSAEDLAKGIYWTLFESNYEELSANARQKTVDCYSEEVVARQYTEVYKNLLAKF